MARIFVSYRRSDSAYVAATLSDKLQQHFGRDSVFFDVDTIPLGVDFREHIGNAVGQCDVLLIIIGGEWVKSIDNQGNRRIDSPADYVRVEIESALKRDIPIIPVLVDEAEMPSANDLPPSIQSIVFRNAAELRAGRDLRQHTELLIRGLEVIFSQKPPTEGRAASEKAPVNNTGQPGSADQGGGSPELLEEIQQALKEVTNRCVFVGKEIPPNKIHNAIKAYADGVSPEDVLLLFDNTGSGVAKDGLLLTAGAIYWRNTFLDMGQLSYTEIRSVEVRRSDPSKWLMGYTALVLNESQIVISFGGDHDRLAESLADVIRRLTRG